MTRIVVQPNASGTGTFTIAAPNSNNARTLTLPDAAGTVFLSDGSGTIQPTNITDGTTSVGTSYVVNGSAKAWVNFNGTGTIAARDSFNVSSLTDNGTGDYTLNWSSAFAAGDYSVTFGSNNVSGVPAAFLQTGAVPAVGSFRMAHVEAGVSADVTYNFVTSHGDLA